MKKLSSLLLILALPACTMGTKEIKKEYWAYTHQVIEQSKTEKVALANVGDVVNENFANPIRSIKLVLKNCNYGSEWVDEHYYRWTGSLANTNKSYSFTTAAGAMRTIPIYNGDCSVQDVTKVKCFSWVDGCIIEEEKPAEETK